MDHKIRTFIALEIAEKPREQAAKFIQSLAGYQAPVTWEPPHKLHITLKFLGDVPNVEINEVCVAVRDAVRGLPPFVFALQGAGAFPSLARPRSFWLGVNEGRDALIRTARAVDSVMQEMGFPREVRSYVPHMTLGRVKGWSPALDAVAEKVLQYDAIDIGKTHARHVTVFASHMARSGSSYTVLSTAPLGD